MNVWMLLAQVGNEVAEVSDEELMYLDYIWKQITSLSWLHAVMAMSFGVVYLLYGWRIFRILVTICFAFIGMFLGIYLGNRINSPMWGGVLGLALMAFVSVPLMKWCVSLLGAAAGGILTGGIWYAFDLPENYIWAGAAVGLVAGGMISFILLKAAVMLFTSLGGSAIIVISLLALLHQYEQLQDPPTTNIHDLVYYQNWFLPVALIVPTVIGIITQNKFIKQSSKWEF